MTGDTQCNVENVIFVMKVTGVIVCPHGKTMNLYPLLQYIKISLDKLSTKEVSKDVENLYEFDPN